MGTVGLLLNLALELYMFFFFVRMIMSFVPVLSPGFTPRGASLVAFETVFTLTDPLINFYDRFLPHPRIGQISFSLGFVVAWLTLVAAQRFVVWMF